MRIDPTTEHRASILVHAIRLNSLNAQQQLLVREERRAEQMRALARHERALLAIALAAREALVERGEVHTLRLG